MRDPRLNVLASGLVNYSCGVKPGDNVLIENTGIQSELVCALVEAVYDAGGRPFVELKDPAIQRALSMRMGEPAMRETCNIESYRMKKMDAYIGVRASDNLFEMSDVATEVLEKQSALIWLPVHGEIRVPKTRWVVIRYPNASMAQQAGLSTSAFEDFYFDVCTMDYAKMSRAMDALVKRMSHTNMVRIVGPGTDISFSIKGQPVIKCDGKANIPDGEVFTAPIKDSVNGQLSYNSPSLHDGFRFENIVFTFENGKIVDAKSNDTARINAVLDIDPGARYIGEFAIGVNPYINQPMLDTLFDEKIAGSFHFTPGACYDECNNSNKSALHWDLVNIQTAACGGGEMYFDDKLVRKDGLFVEPALACLNPEQLK